MFKIISICLFEQMLENKVGKNHKLMNNYEWNRNQIKKL